MVKLATLTLCAACAAAALAAGPAAADPGTTGGLPAVEPPVVSPQGGVHGPGGPNEATTAQAGDETPGADEPATTTPTTTTPETPADRGDSTEVPVTEPPVTRPTATAPAGSSGGGGGLLPHTGFALAALVAVGIGFVLTGYALRYSRALDG